jgi:SHS2 domain-containing protein
MTKAPFKYLSHTADVEFVAYGKDIKEAIENSGLALLNVALDLKKINASKGKVKTAGINEKADTVENLVWFVLQDIISMRAAGYLSAFKFKVDKLEKNRKGVNLKGRLFHKKLKEDYTLLDVKAVTPHDLRVTKTKSGYSINVIIDV